MIVQTIIEEMNLLKTIVFLVIHKSKEILVKKKINLLFLNYIYMNI